MCTHTHKQTDIATINWVDLGADSLKSYLNLSKSHKYQTLGQIIRGSNCSGRIYEKKYSIIAVFCVSSSKNYFKTQGLFIINLHVLRITKIFGIPKFWADEVNLFFIMISIHLCLNILLWDNCFFLKETFWNILA